MKFTPENLIDNLKQIGPWSSYYLATLAIKHYYPEVYCDEDDQPSAMVEVALCDRLDCQYWQDVIIKYHNEIGYSIEALSNDEYVNEH